MAEQESQTPKLSRGRFLRVWRWLWKITKRFLVIIVTLVLLICLVIFGIFVRHKYWYNGALPKEAVIKRVVLVVVDGLRGDLVNKKNTPHLYSLAKSGAYSFRGLTEYPAMTPVGHMSLFTGLSVARHGINDYFKWKQIVKESIFRTTAFDYMHDLGYDTNVLFGWKKRKLSHDEENSFSLLRFFYFKGIDHIDFLDKSPLVKSERALEILERPRPNFLFINFLENDTTGHHYGWGSAEQLAALNEIDEAIGNLRRKLARKGWLDNTLLIVTADHGGLGKTHGSCHDTRCRQIPIIFSGPGVKKNYRFKDGEMIHDILPTMMRLLGDTKDRDFDGVPISGINLSNPL